MLAHLVDGHDVRVVEGRTASCASPRKRCSSRSSANAAAVHHLQRDDALQALACAPGRPRPCRRGRCARAARSRRSACRRRASGSSGARASVSVSRHRGHTAPRGPRARGFLRTGDRVLVSHRRLSWLAVKKRRGNVHALASSGRSSGLRSPRGRSTVWAISAQQQLAVAPTKPVDGDLHRALGRAQAPGPAGRTAALRPAREPADELREEQLLALARALRFERAQHPMRARASVQRRSKSCSGVQARRRARPGSGPRRPAASIETDFAPPPRFCALARGPTRWPGSGLSEVSSHDRKRPRLRSAAARSFFSSSRVKKPWVRSCASSGAWPRRRT